MNRCFLFKELFGICFFGAFLLVIVGCAGVEFTTISNSEGEAKNRGLRYRDSAPYLIVFSDSDGGLHSELAYLPDMSTKMSARPYTFLATSKTALNFSPYFTGMTTKADATEVPKAVVKGLGEMARAFIPASGEKREATRGGVVKIPAPYIFKIVPQENGCLAFVGGQACPGFIYPGRNSFTQEYPHSHNFPSFPQ